MSSVWVIMLGLGAGYLINKRMMIQGQLQKSVDEYENAAKPSDNGITSAEIRTTYKNVEHTKYGDMHERLPKSEMEQLLEAQRSAAAQVQAYDGESASVIHGVMLHFENGA